MMVEKIVAAAINFGGLTVSLPRPARHGQVINSCYACGVDVDIYMPAIQGFVTSTGRFVNRAQAKQIAHIAKQRQLRPEHERSQFELYSEDLW